MRKKNDLTDELQLVASHPEDDEALAVAQAATEEAEAGAATETPEDEERLDWGTIFRSLLNGEFLRNPFIRRQVVFIIFVVILLLLYTGNRYSSQQEIILIDSLKVVVQQEQYNVLTQSSELINLKRQSNIEQILRQHGDSSLINSITPPFEVIPEHK